MINQRTTDKEKVVIVNGTFALTRFTIQTRMFFNPDLAEAQQLENRGDFALLKFGSDGNKLGGDFRVGLAMPL